MRILAKKTHIMTRTILQQGVVSLSLIACMSLLLMTSWGEADEKSNPSFNWIFQNQPLQQDSSGRSNKLARAIARHEQLKPSVWTMDLTAIQGLPVEQKLQAVQAKVNQRITYQDDPDNIWKPPQEAYQNGGDCEDYAIAKLLLLRESGFWEENLRLITLAPILENQVHHVILLARWQDKMYILDSPNRTSSGQVITVEGYKDAMRPIIWAGWSGGYTVTSHALDGISRTFPKLFGPKRGLPGGFNSVSYRDYPAKEKLIRIAADLLIIHPWEPPLTSKEVERLRLLRSYFHAPTPENAHPITLFEKTKLDTLRHMREAL